MGNRKLPFGYQMRMGEIVRNEPEAKAVQDIFLQYTLGASLKEIAEQMSKTGPTYDDGKSWNKNMVARILENAKYASADNYPKLVDIKLFEAAAEKRQTKQRLPERTPAQKALKRVCSKPPTPEIEQQVTHLLGRLAAQPERIVQPEKPSIPTHSTTQIELDNVLNTQPLDEDAARSMICKLAQEQYDTIGNKEYETERLRRLFTAFECTAELNAGLLQINNVKYGTYPVITCTGTYGNPNIAVGKDQMSNSVSPTKLSLYGTTINVGDETSTLYTVNISGGYVKIVGGSYVNIGTSSYYAVMNNSREFRPSTSSSSYPFYLGTSGYPWHYGNIGTLNVVTSAKLGTTTGAKVGFFGTTPIGRKAVSRATGSTVASCNTAINNLITALKAYGLIS